MLFARGLRAIVAFLGKVRHSLFPCQGFWLFFFFIFEKKKWRPLWQAASGGDGRRRRVAAGGGCGGAAGGGCRVAAEGGGRGLTRCATEFTRLATEGLTPCRDGKEAAERRTGGSVATERKQRSDGKAAAQRRKGSGGATERRQRSDGKAAASFASVQDRCLRKRRATLGQTLCCQPRVARCHRRVRPPVAPFTRTESRVATGGDGRRQGEAAEGGSGGRLQGSDPMCHRVYSAGNSGSDPL